MKQKIISETDFDSDTPENSDPVGRNHIESHLTYRQNKDIKGSPILQEVSQEEVDGSPISDPAIVDGGSHPGREVDGVGSHIGSHTVVVKDAHRDTRRDAVNNLTQKESAMAKAGVTREKTYAVIARLLEAKKWADVIDSQGNCRREMVDDLERQRGGVEMALKAFGDLIERREIEVDVGDKTLEVYRSMSVSELKKKASELLLGKRGGVIVDAEISR